MNEILEALLSNEIRICELCGSNEWRILHAGDESNCECEGECLIPRPLGWLSGTAKLTRV